MLSPYDCRLRPHETASSSESGKNHLEAVDTPRNEHHPGSSPHHDTIRNCISDEDTRPLRSGAREAQHPSRCFTIAAGEHTTLDLSKSASAASVARDTPSFTKGL
ncbi:hypothetical protein NHX12_029211 [Muraenolepis orangiensis]|uniref:Uncharacterized protein n=1 Tax=Muraenolepis orangiensis TaxID=630683 RepID=A0A9Q0EEU0_9TELE|nr:hypothetical protein NHX12_029211 [Muraenolepis orangiensis]